MVLYFFEVGELGGGVDLHEEDVGGVDEGEAAESDDVLVRAHVEEDDLSLGQVGEHLEYCEDDDGGYYVGNVVGGLVLQFLIELFLKGIYRQLICEVAWVLHALCGLFLLGP